jgi:hypothetical protein
MKEEKDTYRRKLEDLTMLRPIGPDIKMRKG